jgi:hypothetical protein
MKFEEIASSYKLSGELKEEKFIATIENVKVKKDRHGRDIMLLYISYNGDKYIVSLPPSLMREFARTALQYGFKEVEEIVGTSWLFKRVNPRDVAGENYQGYDRYVPTHFVCTREWLERHYGDKDELYESEVAELKRICAGDELYEWLSHNYVMTKQRGAVVYRRK